MTLGDSTEVLGQSRRVTVTVACGEVSRLGGSVVLLLAIVVSAVCSAPEVIANDRGEQVWVSTIGRRERKVKPSRRSEKSVLGEQDD